MDIENFIVQEMRRGRTLQAVLGHDQTKVKTYILKQDGLPKSGRITVDEDGTVREITPERSLKVANHSPTGFAWGYPGSGPAQSALAILLDYTNDEELSEELHQLFKFDFIAGMPEQGGSVSSDEIDSWLAAKKGTTP